MKKLKLALIATCSILAVGCVESDPSILATAHVLPSCTFSEGAVGIEAVNIDDEYVFESILNIDLAQVATGNQLIGADGAADPPVVVVQGRPIFGVNFGARSQLTSTTDYTSVGYDEELRVNQNQFRLETIEFDVIDSPAAYALSDVPLTGLANSSGGLFISSVPMLGPLQVQQWTSITNGATNGDANSIVPVTIEARMVGSLIDGTSAESNVIRLEALVCNGCGFQTTPICGAGD